MFYVRSIINEKKQPPVIRFVATFYQLGFSCFLLVGYFKILIFAVLFFLDIRGSVITFEVSLDATVCLMYLFVDQDIASCRVSRGYESAYC